MNVDVYVLGACALGLVGGLGLLWRGLGEYRMAQQIGDTSTSRIGSLAAGEVRVTGRIEAAEVTLVSPLQSRECVWYRASVTVSNRNTPRQHVDERGVGFRIRDASGAIRVFPNGARVDAPDQLDDRTDFFGNPPAGLLIRQGSAFATQAPIDREVAVAQLLTVHQPDAESPIAGASLSEADPGTHRYREARLEVGDMVTVVGTALPFGQLPDPSGADRLDRYGDPLVGLEDPEVAADVAEAREAGQLLPADEAWGNAAIPGFGIGRPVRQPELEPGVAPLPLATPAEADRIERTFDIAPDLLVLAATRDAPLLIASGSPGEAVVRERDQFLVGLLGAVIAIASAIVGALVLATR